MKAVTIKALEDQSHKKKRNPAMGGTMAMTSVDSLRECLQQLCRVRLSSSALSMAVLLQVLLVAVAGVASGATIYDQRQSGKTNVRVEVRDALIVAVGDGELGGDYDYNYDYSDLTIKPSQSTPSATASTAITSAITTAIPSKSTTAKATTTSSSSTTSAGAFNITQNAAVVLEAENNSIIFPANVKPGGAFGEPIKIPVSGSHHRPDQIPVVVLHEVHRPNKFLPVKMVEKSEGFLQDQTQQPLINPKDLPMRHCAPGFSLDNQNRCKRIRKLIRERPQLPIGLRFDHRPLDRS